MVTAQDWYKSSTGPADWAEVVVPSDTQDLQLISRAIYVGTGGDLKCIFPGNGQTITLVGVPAGSVLPIRVSRVMAAGTTATNIVSLA